MADLNLKSKNALVRPRITEKAALANSETNAYVFEVSRNATKKAVSDSIREVYKVTPRKVNLLNIPKKQVFIRGKKGTKGGGKKAYVFLKKDDKIDIM